MFWYPLEHYNTVIFIEVLTRDRNVSLSRFLITWRKFHRIKFQLGVDESADSVVWEHDGTWSV